MIDKQFIADVNVCTDENGADAMAAFNDSFYVWYPIEGVCGPIEYELRERTEVEKLALTDDYTAAVRKDIVPAPVLDEIIGAIGGEVKVDSTTKTVAWSKCSKNIDNQTEYKLEFSEFYDNTSIEESLTTIALKIFVASRISCM